MTDLKTSRLSLHLIDVAEAERIVARTPGPQDAWAADFPFEGDIVGVTSFLRDASRRRPPFGHYRISRRVDGLAIGGIGFKGQPRDGCVEVGYGLVPSARGHGYAPEALRALVAVAAVHGVSRLVADTDKANIASQRTLERSGFGRVGAQGDLLLYQHALQ